MSASIQFSVFGYILPSVQLVFYRPKDDLTYQITPVFINFKLITQLEPKKIINNL